MPKVVDGGIICLEKNYKAWMNSHLDLGKSRKREALNQLEKPLNFLAKTLEFFNKIS